MSDCNSLLTEAERTKYRTAIGQLNWVAGISRPDISFSVYKAHTKFSMLTVADVYYVNKIIRNVKSTKNCNKFPRLDLIILQLIYSLIEASITFQMEVVRVDKSSS